MKNNVHERLTLVIDMLGKTKNNFAASIGMAATQIYNVCTGLTAPSHKMYELIAQNYPQINMRWLIVGDGLPLVEPGNAIDGTDMMNRIKAVEEQLANVKQIQLKKSKSKKS